MTTALKRDEVTYSELKSGIKGIGLGEEFLFLQVERKRKLWRLRLMDLFSGDYLTGHVKLIDLEELRHSRRSKPIRDGLKAHWQNIDGIIEKILIEIEDHQEEWVTEKQEKEKPKPQFSEDIEEKIEAATKKILEADNQLEALKPHLDNIIVGEEDTKQGIFVLLRSGKSKDPAMKQMILLKGTEGGGKTTLQRELSEGYRTKNVGRFTTHGLDYAEFEGYEVLMLKELGQMDFEKQGLSTLKFLSSDDRGYTVEMPVKDEETGRFRNVQYKIPAITVISSTTRLILDPQFERRTWLFNVDESKEQTERVALWKAKRQKQENEKLVRAREYTDYEFSKEVIKRFVKQLKPVRVIIPFPETLTVLLGYDILRVRGDLDKVYNFLKFYGMFNIKRLQKIKGRAIYLLTPEICVEALKLIVNPLTNMLSRMDERAKLILTALEEVSDVEEKTINLQTGETVEVEKYCYKGSEITKKVREKIAAKIGKSDRTVRAFLSFLESTAGVISSDGGVGRTPKTFTLLYSTEEIRKKISGILEKLESANKLMPEMEEEAQNWLSSLSEIKTPRNGYNFTQSFGVVTKTPSQNNIPHPKDSISNNDLSTPKRSLPEASEDSWHNKKRSTIQGETIKKEGTPPSTTDIKTDKTPFLILKREEHKHKITMGDGQVLFQCPVCKKFDKPMFFANQHDLDLHLMRLHTGYPIQVKADNSPATETAPEVKPEMSAEFSDDKVAVIGDRNPPDEGNRARCHESKTLPKYAEYADGISWAPICEECGKALNEKLRERAPSRVASGDMLNVLRNRFPEKFVDVEFSDFIVKQGWTQTEAESFLETLEKDGAIFKIGEGWRWT